MAAPDVPPPDPDSKPATSPRALIVDDDPGFLLGLAELVRREGFAVATAGSLKQARGEIAANPPDILLVDLRLPDGSGLDLLAGFEPTAAPEVVLITGNASVETAVDALRRGAIDYVTKPVDFGRIKMALANVTRTLEMKGEIGTLRSDLRKLGHFGPLIGTSPAMQAVYDLIGRVARTDASVLITGETGTGKELVAHAIHHNSPRRAQRFVAIHCGAIPETLLEAELFGHVRGAFTGAVATRPGRFEEANRGTIFLDEVSTMPPSLQMKLLRVIQGREVQRLGGTGVVKVDVRIIAATNYDLARMVPLEATSTARDRAELLVYEEWNYVYQDRATRSPVTEVKGMGQGFRYVLERQGGSWVIQAWTPEDVATPDPEGFVW